MNYPVISKVLGRVMGLEAVLMIPSMITALCYGESLLWYVETAAVAAVLAVLLNLPKVKDCAGKAAGLGVPSGFHVLKQGGFTDFRKGLHHMVQLLQVSMAQRDTLRLGDRQRFLHGVNE